MQPTATKVIGRRSGNRVKTYIFSLPSVGAGLTGAQQEMEGLPKVGTIKGINCACASLDFDLSIRDKTGVSADTVNEIFKTVGENKHYLETEATLSVPYANMDATQKGSLYAIVKNDDGVNATGSITLELTIEIPEAV